MSLTPRGGSFTMLHSREDCLQIPGERYIPSLLQATLGAWNRRQSSPHVDSSLLDQIFLLPNILVEIP